MSRLVIAAGLKLIAVPIDSTLTRRSLASGSRARLPTPAEPERVAPASASRSGPVPPVGAPNGAGNSAVSYWARSGQQRVRLVALRLVGHSENVASYAGARGLEGRLAARAGAGGGGSFWVELPTLQ